MDLMLAFSPEASEGSGRSAPVGIGKLQAVRWTRQGRGSGCHGTERCHVMSRRFSSQIPPGNSYHISRCFSGRAEHHPYTHTHPRPTQPGLIESGPVSVSTFYKLLR